MMLISREYVIYVSYMCQNGPEINGSLLRQRILSAPKAKTCSSNQVAMEMLQALLKEALEVLAQIFLRRILNPSQERDEHM